MGFLGGRILLHDQRDLAITIQTRSTHRRLHAGSFIHGLIHGANFACRKQVILAVGGFDPLFGRGAMFCPKRRPAMPDISGRVRRPVRSEARYLPRPRTASPRGCSQNPSRVRLWPRHYFMKCLRMRGMAARCLVHWVGRMLLQNPARSVREVQAAIQFALRPVILWRCVGPEPNTSRSSAIVSTAIHSVSICQTNHRS